MNNGRRYLRSDRDTILVADPVGSCNPLLVGAAVRAGAVGILDVPRGEWDAGAIDLVVERSHGTFALRFDAEQKIIEKLMGEWHARRRTGRLSMVIARESLDGELGDGRVGELREVFGCMAIAEVTGAAAALRAAEAGYDGLVVVGSEAGGRVGNVESFVLLQQVLELDVPVWLRGGVGIHTAAAAIAGGAVGVVLDGQLALTREAGLLAEASSAIGSMDGSETRVAGGHRFYARPGLPAAEIADDADPAEVAARLGSDPRAEILPIGQDAACAAELARRFVTVGGVVQGMRAAIDAHLSAAAEHEPLAPGRGVAGSLGTRYPIVQGPMTRVSDRPAFADAIATRGGLPFLALSLLSGQDVEALLSETRDLLGDLPWGAGILGFVPPELREEQIAAVLRARPPVALIAGGRPTQAQPLEDAGIKTYLHVPSQGLLKQFLKAGARRFVFEGRECGGHVGPRASFPLWDAQITELLRLDDLSGIEVLFAGGIHDACSSAMVATAGGMLAARGARLGVLMGTAYLFTQEAVETGAIQPTFQAIAQNCERTVLLETAPGHCTRCVETDYVRTFSERAEELEKAGVSADQRWAELEQLNLGRLRIASKGLRREGENIVKVDADEQCREGMFMIGQVATLRRYQTTVLDLHDDVSMGSVEVVEQAQRNRPENSAKTKRPAPLDIAVIGMASVFPGAPDIDRFWSNILSRTNAITEVPSSRWNSDWFYNENASTVDAGKRTPSRWGGFLPKVGFDALAYGIPPGSLAAIDTVQLLSLEVARSALADAGYAEREYDRTRTSVIFGAEGGNDLSAAYGFRAGYEAVFGEMPPELDGYFPKLTEDSFPGTLANVIAGRIANRFDLHGVNYTVDAACASSLAALDIACKELSSGTTDLVLCGGADVHNGINDYLIFSSVHALSPNGQCRSFDAGADGIVLGEGIACLILKRRVDAERDGDRIYAIIEAVAGSSDGRHLGLTAPRKEGQRAAIARAYEQAGILPTSMGLIEAHGTGTVVGDRTELTTLTEVFSEHDSKLMSCALGSVKSQIGHTKCAAGLAGLIKAVLSIYHGVLPPTSNMTEPNPYYAAETSPFRFLERAEPWVAGQRRAGISAFGFGGTNFHAVVSSYDGGDEPPHGLRTWPAELFIFRGSAEEVAASLDEMIDLTARIRDADPDSLRHGLGELAAEMANHQEGRVQVAIVASDLEDLADKLTAVRSGTSCSDGVFLARSLVEKPSEAVAFVYPGQGSQRPGMMNDVFVAFPFLRDLLEPGDRWRQALFPPIAFSPEQRREQLDAITDTRVAQPALGIAGLAATRLLRAVGVEPAMAAGHSYGELVALAAAGVFDDQTLLDLSAARGEAIVEAAAETGDDPGVMFSVGLPAEDLRSRLGEWPDVVLANHNSPTQSVISGPTKSVTRAVEALTQAGVVCHSLSVACAFHSPVVASAVDKLAHALQGLDLGSPTIPVWANSTAAPYPAEPDLVAALIAGQVAKPVRFVDQIEAMYEAGARIFVEAGPGCVLTQIVRKILGDRPHAAIAVEVSGESGIQRYLLALAELAACGVPVDSRPLFEGRVEPVDFRNLPRSTPGWTLDGHLVRTRDGIPLTAGLQPMDEIPVATSPGMAIPGIAESEVAVREYLHNLRHQVAAQRDVMLRFLGAKSSEPVREFDVIPGNGNRQVRSGEAAGKIGSASPGPSDGRTERATSSSSDLAATVIEIVSTHTGYPPETVDPDLDLE
ncbi:MAG: acyltransferase domain-containing protein, partial [Hyphomicrobium sp.]|nr:acyltransferase domain-containing protein [Hyphomicrobium sp.]